MDDKIEAKGKSGKLGEPKMPGIYAFEDQSKDDVLNLLKEDCAVEETLKEKYHGADCDCTWCNEDACERMMKLLTPELPKKDGKVAPEVYIFADQTKEQVKELIEKANKSKPHKAAHQIFEASAMIYSCTIARPA